MKIDIDDEFEELMRTGYPGVNTASVQYCESRIVFWAATISLFGHMCKLAASEDSEEQTKNIKSIQDQIKTFQKEYDIKYKEAL